MALQYAIWTMAANGHEKYATYHDAFHRRARQYLYEDELKVLIMNDAHVKVLTIVGKWRVLSHDSARSGLGSHRH